MNTTSINPLFGVLRRSADNQAGSSLIEFSLIAPVIMLILFCSLEFTRMLRVYHLASSLSREIANVAFRQCAREKSPTALQNCLQNAPSNGGPNAVRNLQNFAGNLVPGTEVLITVYKYETSDSVTPNSGPNGETIGTGTHYFTRAAMLPKDEDLFGTPPYQDRPNGPNVFKTQFLLARSPQKRVGSIFVYPFAATTKIDPQLGHDNRYLFVGEAYVPHSPLVNFIGRMFDSKNARYDAAIF